MESIFYVNGEFVPESKAFVSVCDIGLLRSYGVFDFLITYNRQPFRLIEHLDRLMNSARLIDLNIPWSKDEIANIVRETLKRNPEEEKGIRIILTGGESVDTYSPGEKPSLIIMVKPAKIYPKEYYTKGVKVITFLGKREIPEAKTLNYVKAIRALKKARAENAEDALYTSDGLIYECTVCSFFGVKEGRIITAGDAVLNGITRKTVLELIKDKIPIDYRFMHVSEISTLDEAFLASSGHGIMPVVLIDKTTVGNGKPGSITKRIMKEFEAYTGKGLYQ